MATINLDDMTDAPKKKKKKKLKIKAASSAVPAKKSKSVSLSTAKKSKRIGDKPKKKKKTEPLDTNIDLNSTLDGLGAPQSETETALQGQLMDAIAQVPATVQRDNEQFQEYLTMFKQCAEMARAIEQRFKERASPRDVYPLMKLYEQQREIIADLRAIRDVSELGSVIDDEVLGPMTENIATSFIGFHQAILAWNNANLEPHQISNAKMHFDHLLKKHAKDIEQAYHASSDKMMQIFATE